MIIVVLCILFFFLILGYILGFFLRLEMICVYVVVLVIAEVEVGVMVRGILSWIFICIGFCGFFFCWIGIILNGWEIFGLWFILIILLYLVVLVIFGIFLFGVFLIFMCDLWILCIGLGWVIFWILMCVFVNFFVGIFFRDVEKKDGSVRIVNML